MQTCVPLAQQHLPLVPSSSPQMNRAHYPIMVAHTFQLEQPAHNLLVCLNFCMIATLASTYCSFVCVLACMAAALRKHAAHDQSCNTEPCDVWGHADNQPGVLFQCSIVRVFSTSSHHDLKMDHCCYAGECAEPYECNARMSESEAAFGISTTVGVCVTPIAAGSACTAGNGNTKLI